MLFCPKLWLTAKNADASNIQGDADTENNTFWNYISVIANPWKIHPDKCKENMSWFVV